MSRRLPLIAIATIATLIAATSSALPAAGTGHRPPPPTVVLVHGAFADSSGWNGVIRHLRKDGYPVRAIANPLRGVDVDSEYLTRQLDALDGPIVLVGHSYGGAVITNAAAGRSDVRALVYVAAFVPEEGENLLALIGRPVEHPIPALPLVSVPLSDDPPSPSAPADVSLDPAKFPAVFAGDVDRGTADLMAVTQRPVAGAAFADLTRAAAWRTIPAYSLITSRDRAIAPDLQRFMAHRAGAHTVEVASSHAVMVSHPDAVAGVIETAARATLAPA